MLQKTIQPDKRFHQTIIASVQGLVTPIDRNNLLQWLIVGCVGIGLGGSILVISSLPMKWILFLTPVMVLPFVLMIAMSHVRHLLLAVTLLDITFQLDTYLFYRDEAAALNALGGLNISLATLALSVLYALWLVELLTKANSSARSLFRTSLPLGSYLAIVTLSVVVARDVNLAIFEIFLLLQAFMLFFYIAGTVKTRQDVLFIVTVLLIGLILESLIMIGLCVIGHSITVANITARIDGDTRVGGTIGSPNVAASYLTLLLAPALSILLTNLGRWYKGLALLAFCLGGIALILTYSRGGWIAFILSITILSVLAWHRGWLSLKVSVILITFAAPLALYFQDAIIIRLVGDDNGSAHSRIPLAQIAMRMIAENPLGVGANNFVVVMMRYASFESTGVWLSTVHNKYLLVWSETGIVGLVAFLWFLVATIWRGWQTWRFSDRLLSPLALGFSAAILGHMIHMTVDMFNSRPQVQMLWLVVGLVAAMSRMVIPEVTRAVHLPLSSLPAKPANGERAPESVRKVIHTVR